VVSVKVRTFEFRENDFQTNGLLLDESWCEFLKEHGFYVGLSLDGPKHLHDHYRKSRSGEPSFDRVWRAAKLLQQYGTSGDTNRYWQFWQASLLVRSGRGRGLCSLSPLVGSLLSAASPAKTPQTDDRKLRPSLKW
jgi:hypothetical protein